MLYSKMTKKKSLLVKIGRLIGADAVTIEALSLRFGLSLLGCNHLVTNFNNMEVIDTMKNEGRSAERQVQFLLIAIFWLVDFLLLVSNCVLIFGRKKRISAILAWGGKYLQAEIDQI